MHTTNEMEIVLNGRSIIGTSLHKSTITHCLDHQEPHFHQRLLGLLFTYFPRENPQIDPSEPRKFSHMIITHHENDLTEHHAEHEHPYCRCIWVPDPIRHCYLRQPSLHIRLTPGAHVTSANMPTYERSLSVRIMVRMRLPSCALPSALSLSPQDRCRDDSVHKYAIQVVDGSPKRKRAHV